MEALMAGESARAKAERLRRSAARWEQGADGEEATAGALLALPPSWTVLHDLAWPGRQLANIDHIVIGPAGVFVIDTKNWSGRVMVDDGHLRQNGRDRSTSLRGAADAAASVAGQVTSVRREHVRAVLCLAGGHIRTGEVDGVLVCSTDRLVSLLTSHDEVLPGGVARAVATEVERRVGGHGQPAAATTGGRIHKEVVESLTRPGPRRRTRKRWSGLVSAVVGLATAFVLLTQPQVASSVSDRISDVFVDRVDADDPEPADGEKSKRPKQREKKQSQRD
jgi:hypothetical protein